MANTWCSPSAGTSSDLDYLLVSNLLTRRIRAAWEKKTNEFRTHGKAEPRPLIIVVEEAHKLMNREIASQTAFATIARELRKYYVTLLIVDQRPSQIYDEVMSQFGTRISGWLGDEDDIHAVLSGLSGRDPCAACWRASSPRRRCSCSVGASPCPCPSVPAATTRHSGRNCSEAAPVPPTHNSRRTWGSKPFPPINQRMSFPAHPFQFNPMLLIVCRLIVCRKVIFNHGHIETLWSKSKGVEN